MANPSKNQLPSVAIQATQQPAKQPDNFPKRKPYNHPVDQTATPSCSCFKSYPSSEPTSQFASQPSQSAKPLASKTNHRLNGLPRGKFVFLAVFLSGKQLCLPARVPVCLTDRPHVREGGEALASRLGFTRPWRCHGRARTTLTVAYRTDAAAAGAEGVERNSSEMGESQARGLRGGTGALFGVGPAVIGYY